jgi:hypothetical protein
MTPKPSGFRAFYRLVFLAEHQHGLNVALHVFGTVLGLSYLIAVVATAQPWLALAFPVLHALPGLFGHRLFERSAEVGDVRVTRQDYSPLWFIAANHVMTFELIVKGFYWRKASPQAGH